LETEVTQIWETECFGREAGEEYTILKNKQNLF
jgi:hypothetical protein